MFIHTQLAVYELRKQVNMLTSTQPCYGTNRTSHRATNITISKDALKIEQTQYVWDLPMYQTRHYNEMEVHLSYMLGVGVSTRYTRKF